MDAFCSAGIYLDMGCGGRALLVPAPRSRAGVSFPSPEPARPGIASRASRQRGFPEERANAPCQSSQTPSSATSSIISSIPAHIAAMYAASSRGSLASVSRRGHPGRSPQPTAAWTACLWSFSRGDMVRNSRVMSRPMAAGAMPAAAPFFRRAVHTRRVRRHSGRNSSPLASRISMSRSASSLAMYSLVASLNGTSAWGQ
mmetsp:Transcript_29453/g.70146  ORF Transcript_29453/g.70146 Transcript_29453/m.70146 type:complete len:200 (+) Transcript_29453:127-726(+)